MVDEDFRRFLHSIETTREQANMGLHVAMRAKSRRELDNVVRTIEGQLRQQLSLIEDIRESMDRREFLRSVSVLGLPALLPASAVHDALINPSPTSGRVPSLPRLRSAVAGLWTARQSSQYDQLAAMVPATLAAFDQRNQQHNDAHGLLSLAYQAITGAMAKVGRSDLAWVAAERGVVAGKQSGNPTVIAAAQRMYAHALLAQNRNVQARQISMAAADSLRLDSASAMAVYGACLNTAAIAAARLGDPRAHEHLDEAQRVAQHLGKDCNDMFTAFGVTNVGIHRVSVSVELGEGGVAVEHAEAVNLRTVPPERRAHFFIDVAQAHDHPEAVVEALLSAEAIAPEEVRYNPVARHLVASTLRGRPTWRLQDLAERIGVQA